MKIILIAQILIMCILPLGCNEKHCWQEINTFASGYIRLIRSCGKSDYAIAVGEIIVHYDGGFWNYDKSLYGDLAYGVSCITGDDSDIVGDAVTGDRILHFELDEWSWVLDIEDINSENKIRLLDVWSIDKERVIIAGRKGEGKAIYQFDGSELIEMYSGSEGWLTRIWGSSKQNIYAGGNDGKILKYDGTSWTEAEITLGGRVNDIWGRNENDIYFVTEEVVTKYDGNEWTEIYSDEEIKLKKIKGGAEDELFVVGVDLKTPKNIIMHFDGSEWRDIGDESLNEMGLNDIWISKDGSMFLIGGSGYGDGTYFTIIMKYTCQ